MDTHILILIAAAFLIILLLQSLGLSSTSAGLLLLLAVVAYSFSRPKNGAGNLVVIGDPGLPTPINTLNPNSQQTFGSPPLGSAPMFTSTI